MNQQITVAPPRAVLGFWLICTLLVLGDISAVKAEGTQSLEGEWVVTSSGGENWNGLTIMRQDGGYNVSAKDSSGPKIWEGFYQGNANQIVTSRTVTSEGLAADGFPGPVINALAGKIARRFKFTLSSDGQSAEFVQDQLAIYYYQNTGEFSDYRIVPKTTTLVRVAPTAPVYEPALPAPPVANTAVSGPSPQEISVQQRQKEAHDLNEQGVQYYNNKQWQQAADAFKAALDKNPDDQTVRNNYEHALQAGAAASGTGGNKGTTPLTQVGPAGAGGSQSALDQAHTSNKETHQGLESGGLENTKEQSNKVFDKSVPLPVDLRNAGNSTLPAFVMKDKEIVEMQKTRNAFLATQQKKDAELTQIRKQIEVETDSKTKGDLMVRAAQIKAESSQAEYKAALKDKDIQKRAKLLIETHVQETPQKTFPPESRKTAP